jgi:hypothetical protein
MLHDFELNAENRIVYKVLVLNLAVKIPLRKPSPQWEDNIKTDLTEIGCKCVDWIHLA